MARQFSPRHRDSDDAGGGKDQPITLPAPGWYAGLCSHDGWWWGQPARFDRWADAVDHLCTLRSRAADGAHGLIVHDILAPRGSGPGARQVLPYTYRASTHEGVGCWDLVRVDGPAVIRLDDTRVKPTSTRRAAGDDGGMRDD